MKTISRQQAHKVFMYGTHEQLKKSVDRWIKEGIAEPTDEYYQFKRKDAKQYKLWVKNGSFVYSTSIAITPHKNGYELLNGSL